MLRIAGQTAGLIGLNFFLWTLIGGQGGDKLFSRATPGSSASNKEDLLVIANFFSSKQIMECTKIILFIRTQ